MAKNKGRKTGAVKWFNAQKGYGFLSRADGPDVFVHYSNILGDGYRVLDENDKVTFDLQSYNAGGKSKLQAVNVEKVDE